MRITSNTATARTFVEVLNDFLATYPEFQAYVSEQGLEDIKDGFVKRQIAAYRTSDRDEHNSSPTPPHIRDAFLPFHVEVNGL